MIRRYNRCQISVMAILTCTVGSMLFSPSCAQSSLNIARSTQDGPATRPGMEAVTAANSVVELDIPYVENGHYQQRLDIYAPKSVSGAPVILFVHGGEWTKGDKSEVARKPEFFNNNGVVFVAVNYRLSGTRQHPAQVNDVASAVRWVKDHIASYGGDPEKIVLMGHSAGCHIVTLTGLDPKVLATVGLKPSDLDAVVSWSGGAFDLVDKVRQGGMYSGYIRVTFGQDENVWRDASPINHVSDFSPLPNFLFVSADGDRDTSKAAGDRMVALIREAGGTADRVIINGKNHRSVVNDIGKPGDRAGAVLLEYVQRVTGGAPGVASNDSAIGD